jgi:TonB family protein
MTQTTTHPEKRLFGRSILASMAIHIAVSLLISGVLLPPRTPASIPEGVFVELVEVAEPIEEVVEPTPGVTSPRGEIHLPTERRQPRTKPRTRTTRQAPKPPPIDPVKEAPPVETPAQSQPKPGAGGRVETDVPFPFAYYSETITRLIMARWAPMAGIPDSTSAVVKFRIRRSGATDELDVLRASGISGFDRDAVAAVRAVGTFPPLPDGFRGDDLLVRFHFVYQRGY